MKRARQSSSQIGDGECNPSASSKLSPGIKRQRNDEASLSETLPSANTLVGENTFLNEMFDEIQEIKRMLAETLRILNKKSVREDSEEEVEEEYCIEKEPTFPLRTMEDLNFVEEKLRKERVYGSRIMNMELLVLRGSENASKFVRNILEFLMTDELAARFMFTGAKAPFKNFESLLLFEVITRAVKKKFKTTEDKLILEEIGTWLENCKIFQRCPVCTSRRNR